MNETMTIVNFLLCLFGGFLCVCRMDMMTEEDAKTTIRWQYTIYLGIFVASAIGWADTGVPPQWPQVVMTGGLAFNLLLGFDAWKNGLPYYAMKKPQT